MIPPIKHVCNHFVPICFIFAEIKMVNRLKLKTENKYNLVSDWLYCEGWKHSLHFLFNSTIIFWLNFHKTHCFWIRHVNFSEEKQNWWTFFYNRIGFYLLLLTSWCCHGHICVSIVFCLPCFYLGLSSVSSSKVALLFPTASMHVWYSIFKATRRKRGLS